MASLCIFAWVASITPGPNNLMLMSSGMNFGFRKTVPHMLGVAIGVMVMIFLVGIGLASIFDAYPFSYRVLQAFSAAYLLYLAVKIAKSTPHFKDSEARAAPVTFIQAALFQWVNPKAWAMSLAAVSLYSSSHGWGAVTTMAFLFGIINLPAVSLWAFLGLQLRMLLGNPRVWRAFNLAMALLLVSSLYFSFSK